MGSFLWDNQAHDICYTQYHNGRPLSVALIEPDGFEPPEYVGHDFTLQPPNRSRSLGRRIKRESYSRLFHCREREKNVAIRLGVHYPNTQYQTFSYTPVLSRRGINFGSSRDMLVEKLGR